MLDPTTLVFILATLIIALPLLAAVAWSLLGFRYVPHDQVGVVERLWSPRGALTEGRILATQGEAGFQADILRGGVHTRYPSFAYRVHRVPLVTVPEGSLAYVYARDGEALAPTQSLGRTVPSNDFQDARAFLGNGGQRGRQRAILREGVYAINLSLFVVLARDRVYTGPLPTRELDEIKRWHIELQKISGFTPIRIGGADDTIGVVTVHDGPSLNANEIIAPEVRAPDGSAGHSCYQDPDAFLKLGGKRGLQLDVITDGTWFVNRWFATVEPQQKTVIPIGYVGVVVSYHGITGEDVTGDAFRYGEQVESGHRGVWKRALPPGKYALNPYAIKVEHVPTVNFVLRWVTGQVEAHSYDKDLVSIELVTADGYEPLLPLSLVLHIDYERAPRVVQRFGDVQRLISQTLDPILSAYFRDVAQNCNMLDLLTKREELQTRATNELGRRFQEYDIRCVAVMIGRPESKPGPQDDPIEHLFDQLRTRRLAEEQIATWRQQQEAAVQLKSLRHAEAEAQKQTELTGAEMDVAISARRGDAHVAEAERQAKVEIARADGEAAARRTRADADSWAIGRTGLAEAAVSLHKVRALGDPRLVALDALGLRMSQSVQPLVPEHLVTMGNSSGGEGPLARLIELMLAEKGLSVVAGDVTALEKFAASVAADEKIS